MTYLQEDTFEVISRYLDDQSIFNLIIVSNRFANFFANSLNRLSKFTLSINADNYKIVLENSKIKALKLKNISIDLKSIKYAKLEDFLNNLKSSLEYLELINLSAADFKECLSIFNTFVNLKHITLNNCNITSDVHEKLPQIPSLIFITFNQCDENILKIFSHQTSISKITIQNYKFSWNGFSHGAFNELAQNCTNLTHLVLIGAGTGSYFDNEDFPYEITILETTVITFHWYVGIKNARINFLESQKGNLKRMTIHELPYDFDGGKVLKYIIEEMKLDKFYYGNIPLILNGQKQEVKKFSANEIQIQSIYEMFRQYPHIEIFELKLSPTDISSGDIKKIINLDTNLFNNLVEFILVDNSEGRGIFGVFLGLYKNFRNIKKLTFQTLDRNVNVILEECLPKMNCLEEIFLISTVLDKDCFKIIRKFVPKLQKLSIYLQYVAVAKEIFESDLHIIGI